MRKPVTAILVLAAAAGCRRYDYPRSHDPGEAQVVALCVRSTPPGATVRVNRIDKVWVTPCDIADYAIERGMLDVEVSMDDHETVRSRVAYDGQNPATLKVKLRSKRGAKAPVRPPAPELVQTPAPVEPAPPKETVKAPEPAQEKPAPEKPAPVKIEAVAGGTRMKINSPGAKLRIQAKTVVSEVDKPGEIFLPDVPPEKVTVELLDPKTDAVIASIEFAPSMPKAPPVVQNPPPVVPPPGVDGDRVGEVKVVHKTYGVFVKLDPGLSLQPGEEIIVYRGGKEVARTKILKVTKADDNYPDGGAQVQKDAQIQKGDEVRRAKP